MRYAIAFAPDADNTLQGMRAYDRILVLDAIERYLRYEPRRTSRSRIKALRDLAHPQYRLLVGGIRVFYDVGENTVEILAVVRKGDAALWLARWGIPLEQEGGSP